MIILKMDIIYDSLWTQKLEVTASEYVPNVESRDELRVFGFNKQVNLLDRGKPVSRAGNESSLLVRLLPPTHCRCKTHTHTRRDSPTRRIGQSQKHLVDNTHHSQQREGHASGNFRTRNPSKRAAADAGRSCTKGNSVNTEKPGFRWGAHSDPTVRWTVTARRLRLTSPLINIHSWYENNIAATCALGSETERVPVIYHT
jgi:hypothetical protein